MPLRKTPISCSTGSTAAINDIGSVNLEHNCEINLVSMTGVESAILLLFAVTDAVQLLASMNDINVSYNGKPIRFNIPVQYKDGAGSVS